MGEKTYGSLYAKVMEEKKGEIIENRQDENFEPEYEESLKNEIKKLEKMKKTDVER